jgi:hypothetical protein
MEHLHLSVIPAKAGIHLLQVRRDPCLRRDDGEEAFCDTLIRRQDQKIDRNHGKTLRCGYFNRIRTVGVIHALP